MTLKNKIMIAINYTFAYAYVFLGSIGIISGICMIADISIDGFFRLIMSKWIYWVIIILLGTLIGTKQNILEGRILG